MPKLFHNGIKSVKNVSSIAILTGLIIFISKTGVGEKTLNFAKNQIVSVKQNVNNKDEYIKIIELPKRFPIKNPKVKVRLPKWRPEADFDVIEIGKELLKGIKNREKDHRDQPDQLISELKQSSNIKSKRVILEEEEDDLNEIIEEFQDDQD